MQNSSNYASSFPEQKWAKLISQVAEGSESALGILYDDTSPLVYGLALRILNDAAEAEEVTLDVYMQVWRKAADYDMKRSSPSGWLLMLTRSRAIDRLRAGAQKRRFEELLEIQAPSFTTDPQESALMLERRKAIQNALSKLNPQQKKAVELVYFYGLSQSEIATRLGQPIGTVKSWIRLGMINLRELLRLFEKEE